MVVGKFALAQDVSGVAIGSQIMHTVTGLISSLAMGTTILLGQKLGEGNAKSCGKIIVTSIVLFLGTGLLLTILIPLCSGQLAALMNAPSEAFEQTSRYIAICGAFSSDLDVVAAGFDYLKAYGIDCLLTCFLFCFI